MASPRKRVALLIESSNAYARGLLRGITRYQQLQQEWLVFFPEQERGAPPPEWLRNWRCDGMIARIETERIAEFVSRYQVPTVDVSAARLVKELPWVETDDETIGALGAEHLMQRGFQNYAFCGDPGFNWSLWRCESFRKSLAKQGLRFFEFQSVPKYAAEYSWVSEFERLKKWLQELPKPIGVMACYDIKARQVLEACNDLDLAVPEQVAILGVDNDPLICDTCNPPLTSISLDAVGAGFRAARLLNEMMNGKPHSGESVRIAPIEIQERLSTDTVAVEDPDVATALRFIRENAIRNIRVADVLEHVNISRRKLESRFKKIIGNTPHEEIQRRRFDRVKNLLRHTDFSVAKIASLTGFDHSEYLSVAFQRETGMKITDYIKENRKSFPMEI